MFTLNKRRLDGPHPCSQGLFPTRREKALGTRMGLFLSSLGGRGREKALGTRMDGPMQLYVAAH